MPYFFVFLTACLFALAGCSADDPSPNHDHGTHGTTNTATNNLTNNMTAVEVDTYADGMNKTGEAGLTFTLVSADPAPPDVGENTWTVRVTDGAGAAVDGASVTVTPFMPAHDHGTSPAEYSGAFIEDGTYVVGPFNLFMPGTWELTVAVEGDGGDEVVFAFDLEG